MEKLFSSSKCLGQDEIQKYLKEQLTNQERFRVENHLLDCPLCTDAVEGFANGYNFDEDIELREIETALATAEKTSPTKVRTLPSASKSF